MSLAEGIAKIADNVNDEQYCFLISKQYLAEIRQAANEGLYSYYIKVATLDEKIDGKAKYLARYFESEGFKVRYDTRPSYSKSEYFVVVSWG